MSERIVMPAIRNRTLRLPIGRSAARALAVCLLAVTSGCMSSSTWVTVRDTPRNPLAGTLDLVSRSGPKPTERTLQLLRRYNLADDWHGDRVGLLGRLEQIQQREPARENEYAMAELAYITAKESEALHQGRALEFYGTSLIHAYRYLFDYEAKLPLNAYDPQFRGASDLYNQSLEGMLRLVHKESALQPGTTRTIKTSNHDCSYDIVMRSHGWHDDDFERFEFVSDYKVQGLRNHYHTYGLGVPLIAVRRVHADDNPAELYYPPNLCFPVTAFLRVANRDATEPRQRVFDPPPVDGEKPSGGSGPRFVLELYDPLEQQSI